MGSKRPGGDTRATVERADGRWRSFLRARSADVAQRRRKADDRAGRATGESSGGGTRSESLGNRHRRVMAPSAISEAVGAVVGGLSTTIAWGDGSPLRSAVAL